MSTVELTSCKRLWILFVLLLVPPCFAQQHAPSPEQCKADQSVWGSSHARTEYEDAERRHIEDGTPNRTDIALAGIPELLQRMKEMYECSDVVAMEPYHETGNFYHGVIADRYFGFISRHGLIRQMMKEDAAGKR